MAQHLLNGSQVRAVLQQMHRKGMAQGVGVMSFWMPAFS